MNSSSSSHTSELELDQDLEVTIPLIWNEAATEELGPGEDHENAVYEKEFRNFYSNIRIPRLRFGVINDPFGKFHEASLMVLDLTFHASKPQKYRFRRAELSVSFLRSDEKASKPTILAFAPASAYGSPTPLTEEKGWAFELADPFWSSIKATHERKVTVERKGRFAITGSKRGSPPYRVVWTMDEGVETKNGLPLNIQTAILFSAAAPCKICFDIDTEIGAFPAVVRALRQPSQTLATLWSGDRSTSILLDLPKLRAKQSRRGSKEELFEMSELTTFVSFSEPSL